LPQKNTTLKTLLKTLLKNSPLDILLKKNTQKQLLRYTPQNMLIKNTTKKYSSKTILKNASQKWLQKIISLISFILNLWSIHSVIWKQGKWQFYDLIWSSLNNGLTRTHVLALNNQILSQKIEKMNHHRIFIGIDLLQKVTNQKNPKSIKHLTISLPTGWRKSISTKLNLTIRIARSGPKKWKGQIWTESFWNRLNSSNEKQQNLQSLKAM